MPSPTRPQYILTGQNEWNPVVPMYIGRAIRVQCAGFDISHRQYIAIYKYDQQIYIASCTVRGVKHFSLALVWEESSPGSVLFAKDELCFRCRRGNETTFRSTGSSPEIGAIKTHDIGDTTAASTVGTYIKCGCTQHSVRSTYIYRPALCYVASTAVQQNKEHTQLQHITVHCSMHSRTNDSKQNVRYIRPPRPGGVGLRL